MATMNTVIEIQKTPCTIHRKTLWIFFGFKKIIPLKIQNIRNIYISKII